MNDDTSDVLTALHGSLGEVSMSATADEIVTAARARWRRHRLVGVAAGVAAITGLAFAANYGGPVRAPTVTLATGGVHIHTVAFTVDSLSDGSVRLTWDKQRYFDDRDALQDALHQAGMPVVMRVGEFCAAPGDDTTLDPSGVGPGVEQVMKGESSANGEAVFVFTPSAMPAGKELFIGYLDAAQLATTQGNPGSVERLVSTGVPLTCTTTPPPPNS